MEPSPVRDGKNSLALSRIKPCVTHNQIGNAIMRTGKGTTSVVPLNVKKNLGFSP
jgi:hypothetical protein